MDISSQWSPCQNTDDQNRKIVLSFQTDRLHWDRQTVLARGTNKKAGPTGPAQRYARGADSTGFIQISRCVGIWPHSGSITGQTLVFLLGSLQIGLQLGMQPPGLHRKLALQAFEL